MIELGCVFQIFDWIGMFLLKDDFFMEIEYNLIH